MLLSLTSVIVAPKTLIVGVVPEELGAQDQQRRLIEIIFSCFRTKTDEKLCRTTLRRRYLFLLDCRKKHTYPAHAELLTREASSIHLRQHPLHLQTETPAPRSPLALGDRQQGCSVSENRAPVILLPTVRIIGSLWGQPALSLQKYLCLPKLYTTHLTTRSNTALRFTGARR